MPGTHKAQVIAFDIFFVLCLGWRAHKKIRSWAIIGVALFIIMLVAVGSGVNGGRNPPYYGVTKDCKTSFFFFTLWKRPNMNFTGCWIRPEYKTDRIVLEWVWIWVAAFTILALYGVIGLLTYGFIGAEGGKIGLINKGDRRVTDSRDDEEKRITKLMLL